MGLMQGDKMENDDIHVYPLIKGRNLMDISLKSRVKNPMDIN